MAYSEILIFLSVVATRFLPIKFLWTISHKPGSQFLTVRPLQCPVGLHHSCPWLKYLVVLGCAMRWTLYYDTGAERGWPSATCL